MTSSLLEAETGEQPDVAARLLDATWPRLDELARVLRPDRVSGVVVTARGSSDNAARYAQYLLGLRLGLPVALAAPSLTSVYGRPPALEGRAVVAVSQSGGSPDVVSVVAAAREQGCPTLAVTNDPASPLAAEADAVLPLLAGPERSVAATKTYTASLLAMALLAVALDDPSAWPAAQRQLREVPDAMAATLATDAGAVDAAARLLEDADRGVAVGRGLNLATAFEAALKVTELTGTLVAPFSPADLLHGPVAAVGPDVPAVLVAPREPATESVLAVAGELRRRGCPLLVIAHREGAGDVLDDADAVLALPPLARAPVADWLTPLVAVLPAQRLAARLAVRRGVDVDRPGGLTKVTRTT